MTLPVAIIDKLAFGGNGVCRIDGKVCFVPFSCPGDEVRLSIMGQKKSYCTAEIREVLTPSPYRIVPLCPIFGACGGCSWQHIHYPVQLEQKRQIFTEALWRGARVGGEVISDVVAAPAQYGYRSRVQFKVAVHHGTLQIGFYRHGSHVVEDAADGCPVAMPNINEILKCFRAFLPEFPDLVSIPQISIDAGEQGTVAIVHYTGKDIPTILAFLREHSGALGPCTGLFLQAGQTPGLEQVWGSDEISYRMPHRGPLDSSSLLTYRPGGFAQVNQIQNVAMLSIIRRLGEFRYTDTILDLYCGNGNFSIPLAAEVASVVGIEGSADSIRSAEHNRACNAVHNVEFICDEVSTGIQQCIRDGRVFEAVLLDPPRTGAGNAVSDIVRLNPRKIIYVSCDPSTLARDCGLLAGHGYRVIEAVPLDMFPQTYHLESVTLLIKE